MNAQTRMDENKEDLVIHMSLPGNITDLCEPTGDVIYNYIYTVYIYLLGL